MVRRPFKTEATMMKNYKDKKSSDEVIATNIIKEIPLNEPPSKKVNSIKKSDNSYEFTEKVSNKMGEMILQGYTMLDEVCGTCGNVLLANQRKEKGCVACAMLVINEMGPFERVEDVSKEKFGLLKIEKANSIQEGTEKLKETTMLPEKSLSDKISSKMGELLVKGHTMLDEYCVTCSGILMKDPQTSTKNCIACQISKPQEDKLNEKNVGRGALTINKKKSSHEIVIKNKAVAERLKHTSSIVGDSTLPISPQDVLINLEIVKECLNILKEYDSNI
uniref:Sjoegren syndrome/scleroderma autoantigen 1 n=1 Tax=Strongyloides stercoralis TaxID=6248 RepID=A0AAF5DEI2_STRER